MSKDANHNQLAQAFVRLGASFHGTPGVGRGFPDGVAGIGGWVNLLVEFKLPSGTYGGVKTTRTHLNQNQRPFHEKWRGYPPFVCRTEADVRAVVQEAERLSDVLNLVGNLTPDELRDVLLRAARAGTLDAGKLGPDLRRDLRNDSDRRIDGASE